MGGNSTLQLPQPITTTQTPTDATSAGWQRLHPGYFGVVFVQWNKVELETEKPTGCLFLQILCIGL